VVRGALAEAAIEGGVPAAAMVEALDALAARHRPRARAARRRPILRALRASFTAAGDPIEVGRVLWAELDTQARGKISIHRFRPRQSTDDRFGVDPRTGGHLASACPSRTSWSLRASACAPIRSNTVEYGAARPPAPSGR